MKINHNSESYKTPSPPSNFDYPPPGFTTQFTPRCIYSPPVDKKTPMQTPPPSREAGFSPQPKKKNIFCSNSRICHSNQ